MGNTKLRRELGKIFKKNGLGRIYTCPKRQAYRWLNGSNMRDMIKFLKISPGTKVFDRGVNQIVAQSTLDSKPVAYMMLPLHHGHRTYGYVFHNYGQIEYESGYLSCGCGYWSCFTSDDPFRLRSKQEIEDNFYREIHDEWASGICILYFKSLDNGLDIIDDDGFLIPNWRQFQ